ncbi:hypothetical protein AAMO2058_000687700 [Amorphochlora amoebiformis]
MKIITRKAPIHPTPPPTLRLPKAFGRSYGLFALYTSILALHLLGALFSINLAGNCRGMRLLRRNRFGGRVGWERNVRRVTRRGKRGGDESMIWPSWMSPQLDPDVTNPALRFIKKDSNIAVLYKPNGVSIQNLFDHPTTEIPYHILNGPPPCPDSPSPKPDPEDITLFSSCSHENRDCSDENRDPKSESKRAILSGMPPAYQLAKTYGGLVVIPLNERSRQRLRSSTTRGNITLIFSAVIDGSLGQRGDCDFAGDQAALQTGLECWIQTKTQVMSWGRGRLSMVDITCSIPTIQDFNTKGYHDTYCSVNIAIKEITNCLSALGHPVIAGSIGRGRQALRGSAARGVYLALTGINLQQFNLHAKVKPPGKFSRLLLREARFFTRQMDKTRKDSRRLHNIFLSLQTKDTNMHYLLNSKKNFNKSAYAQRLNHLGLERVTSRDAAEILESLGISTESPLPPHASDRLLSTYMDYFHRNPAIVMRTLRTPHTASTVGCLSEVSLSASSAETSESLIVQSNEVLIGDNIQPDPNNNQSNPYGNPGGDRYWLESVGISHDRSEHSEFVALNHALAMAYHLYLSGIGHAIGRSQPPSKDIISESRDSGISEMITGNISIHVNHIVRHLCFISLVNHTVRHLCFMSLNAYM